jgi:uncharacterized protein YndB with AHSA1/START domain
MGSRQLRDVAIPPRESAQHLSPDGIGEGAKDDVERLGRIINHRVNSIPNFRRAATGHEYTGVMAPEIDNDALAQFKDRHTMRYVRFYPVEVARLWKAVTSAEHLNIWLYPVTKVEPRLGGRCSFSWGAPDDPTFEGTVSRFDPFKQVRYEVGAENYIQFDLLPVEGGTRFIFTQFFGPGFRHADDGQLEGKDGAQPAGPGTPWRAGFLAGFHLNFRYLETFIGEEWSEGRIDQESRRRVELANSEVIEDHPPASQDEWRRLVDVYYDHVLATCPTE